MVTRDTIGDEGLESLFCWKIRSVLALEGGEVRGEDAVHRVLQSVRWWRRGSLCCQEVAGWAKITDEAGRFLPASGSGGYRGIWCSTAGYTSRLTTFSALPWMNSRRGSTTSPIRVSKILPASSACSIRT